MATKVITQERVKSLFDYREDGNLVRRVQTSNRVKIGDVVELIWDDNWVPERTSGDYLVVGLENRFIAYIDRDHKRIKVVKVDPVI